MTDDDLTDAEKSKMAGNLLRMGKARTGPKVEMRRSRLPAGTKPIPRFEIVPGKIDGEECWRFCLLGNGHRVELGEEWEHKAAKEKARTLEAMGMRVEWVRA